MPRLYFRSIADPSRCPSPPPEPDQRRPHTPGRTTSERESAKSKFTDKQIIGILKEAKPGAPVTDLRRMIGIRGHTFYRWRSKFGGMEVSEARRLKQVEDENRELKQMVADLGPENRALKAALGKKW